MTRRHGYALLAAIVAVIVALSTAIYVGVAADARTRDRTALSGSGPSRPSAAPAAAGTWVGAWSASPVGAEPGTAGEGMAGRSVRNVVHTGVGGTSARITLSNLYGRTPLTITHASIALTAGHGTAAANAGSMRRLTFAGRTTVVIAAGGQVLSDAVALAVPAGGDVLVTTYSPTLSGPVTYHPWARQTSYAGEGDLTGDASGTAFTERVDRWRYLTALDVLTDEADGTVVAFGDSLTDGKDSTADTNHRWPDFLNRRLRTALAAGQDLPRYSVVNAGIGGNRVLVDARPPENQAGLKRFRRDVLERPNVKVVVIDLGINDILRTPGTVDADKLLTGLRDLVRQAHAHGIKVIGGTLMPFGDRNGWTKAREGVRQTVNAEIRAGRVYDAVVDFDKAVRDPYDPRTLRTQYDSGDRLHPNDRGYERMADTFDLEDLKGAAAARL
ncbi:SGNH/GDSL hydrolase family protein [Streptomyces griseorubiginosus]|uniref:SGNH/GDSL hydrolase family protein n=1 Tax=Streptomyces griseorubiginosus TaxID=67304 RepID=UPI002E822E5E|nr:SGNH/GDSL hydrolase family protein [Streptomyces griseorubiginosus]WUB46760.1 SGNH/GDSL hydrolase family protein [Streptomyces griseorubiginosus]WUB55282.1 SGNH/GDSL hydrolase family protein [Streptomyces griseorubiginosus]